MATFGRVPFSQGVGPATKMRPWHSVRETDRKVYHDDSRCPEAGGIEPQYRRDGTEGRRKCEHCQQYP